MGDEAQPEAQATPPAPDVPRQKGTVKWFNATKGFGFVTPADGGDDLFVHQTSIEAEGFRSLREGEEVEFDVEAGADGRTKAVKVTGPDGAAPQGAPRRSSYRSSSAAAAAAAAAAGAPPGPVGGGYRGRGRGGPVPLAYGYGYGAFDYYGAYPGYPAYPAYPPRGLYVRGRGPRGRGGRFAGPGRGGYLAVPPGGPPGESSGLQVVVHNLPWTTTWQQLKDAFKEWKVERADVVYDSWGKSRGFGTVRFGSKEDAEAACSKLNNTEYEGRTITVRLDRFA